MEEYGTLHAEPIKVGKSLHAEPIKVGKYKGHKYFVNMNQFLCLNGYAEIPENWKEGEEDYIDVHGGVTFKGYLINGEEKLRVIGFDTMHFGDSPTYWNLCRVEKECKHLIDGIIEVMGGKIMELITAINMLEQWRPIMEWDEHIKELPSELKECWGRILKARDKGRSADQIGLSKVEIREISELINKDLQPTKAFWKYGVRYTRQKAEMLGMKDVIDSYYRRVKSYYLVDVVTKEKRQFYSLQDVAKFLRRKDYRSISKYVDRGLLITRTSYKIYKYRTFKKRKRF